MASAPSSSIINWMQSLSDQTRTRLLRILQKNELTVVEICSVLQLPQSTVSRHLKILADDGWLTSRRESTANFYRMKLNELNAQQARLWGLVRDQVSDDDTTKQDDRRLSEVLASRRSRSQAFFSNSHDRWDQLRVELFGSRIDAFTMGAFLDSSLVVGDLGCGTAGFTQMLAAWVTRVVAVDSSAAMLQSARKRLKGIENVELRRGELTALPIDAAELHMGLLLLVLPYVESPELVLAEAARAIRKGGRLIIVDMMAHQRTNYREELGHTWLGFEEKQLRDWLLESGWKPQRWQPVAPDPNAKGPELFIMTAQRQ